MPVQGASGSKATPGGIGGSSTGQSMGKSLVSRGGNVNTQGSRQARRGSLGTTKAQVNAGVIGTLINSPVTTPFTRAQAKEGSLSRGLAQQQLIWQQYQGLNSKFGRKVRGLPQSSLIGKKVAQGTPAAIAAAGLQSMIRDAKREKNWGKVKALEGALKSQQAQELER